MIRRSYAAFIVVGAVACLNLPARPPGVVEFWGFTGPWDTRSHESVKANSEKLARVITGWITLDSLSFRPVRLYHDASAIDPALAGRTMALITTYEGSRFHPEIIRGLGGSEEAAALTAGAVAAMIDSAGYSGVVIDFEGMTARDLDALRRVTKAVADSVRAHGVTTVAIAVPAADTTAYPGALLLESADIIMPLLYDQHWSASPPGPIASPEWVRRQLGVRVAEVGAERIVAALPLYGYRWRRSAETEVIGFEDARRLSIMTNTPLRRDLGSATLNASSPEGWEVWVSDRVLIETLVRDARRLGVSTFALWRLGLEDPSMWQALGGR
jgi:spore germination protein YaaH